MKFPLACGGIALSAVLLISQRDASVTLAQERAATFSVESQHALVDKYCAVIASKSPEALRIGKAAYRAQAGLPLPQAYETAVSVMVDNMLRDDAKEGIGAFLEKRMPEWPGA